MSLGGAVLNVAAAAFLAFLFPSAFTTTTHASPTCGYQQWALADALMEDGYCAHAYHTGMSKPRGIWIPSDSSDVLVLERGRDRIVALHDDDDDGRVDTTSVIAVQSGVNHGLAVGAVDPTQECRLFISLIVVFLYIRC